MERNGRTGDQEWTMHEIVRASGVTSRTLRHYHQVGLLVPVRTGPGGLRVYDREGLLRLQRILLLRELGVGLAGIGRILAAAPGDRSGPLREHLVHLEQERERLGRVAEAVRTTIGMIEDGGDLVAGTMFDGFDHTEHREEVEQRWGREAYVAADAWWRGAGTEERDGVRAELDALVAEFDRLAAAGEPPGGPAAQEATGRLHRWVARGWGGREPSAEAFRGLGALYVADPRFGAAFTREGRELAPYVRDAMGHWAEAAGSARDGDPAGT